MKQKNCSTAFAEVVQKKYGMEKPDHWFYLAANVDVLLKVGGKIDKAFGCVMRYLSCYPDMGVSFAKSMACGDLWQLKQWCALRQRHLLSQKAA